MQPDPCREREPGDASEVYDKQMSGMCRELGDSDSASRLTLGGLLFRDEPDDEEDEDEDEQHDDEEDEDDSAGYSE